MNEKSIFNGGINYDSYFKKNVSQSGFNLRLTELIKQMLKEMKDDLFSDTLECSEFLDSKEDLLNWSLSQEKKPKGSDLIVVNEGPMAGTWRVKSQELKTVDDLVKISGTVSSSGGSSSVYVRIGDKTYSPDENGIIDLTDEFKTESGESVIQVITNVQQEVTEVTTEVQSITEKVSEIEPKVESLETTVTQNTEKVTKVEADLSEVHERIDNVIIEATEEATRVATEAAIEKAEEIVEEVKTDVETNKSDIATINATLSTLDTGELSDLNDAIEITPDE